MHYNIKIIPQKKKKKKASKLISVWAKGQGFRGINREQKDAVQQFFKSNGWPWNGEVTDVCETESTALSTSLDKPRPFVFKLSSLDCFLVLK